MVLDRTLADTEIRGDILIWMAGQNQLYDLALPQGEAREARRRLRLPCQQLVQIFLLPLDHSLHPATQGAFSGQSLAQHDLCSLVSVACDNPAPLASNCAARR